MKKEQWQKDCQIIWDNLTRNQQIRISDSLNDENAKADSRPSYNIEWHDANITGKWVIKKKTLAKAKWNLIHKANQRVVYAQLKKMGLMK